MEKGKKRLCFRIKPTEGGCEVETPREAQVRCAFLLEKTCQFTQLKLPLLKKPSVTELLRYPPCLKVLTPSIFSMFL